MKERFIKVKEFHMKRKPEKWGSVYKDVITVEIYLVNVAKDQEILFKTIGYFRIEERTFKDIGESRKEVRQAITPLMDFFEIDVVYEKYEEKLVSEFKKVE